MERNLLQASIRTIKKIPLIRSVIPIAKWVSNTVMDSYESLFGLRDEIIPPRRMIFIGDGDFKEVGGQFLKYFIEIGGLRPTDKVLDVGCGIGRMAVPLTGYLSGEGCYEGMDIVKEGINWCQKKITPRYPNFQFHIADIYNKRYNPKGKYQSAEYKFPYQDESFDFIFLTSVFTHMLARDMENYLSEISRVLKKNGTCFITFFLLNEESSGLIDKNKSKFGFKYQDEDCRLEDKKVPESAVAYEEGFVRSLHKKYELSILEPIQYGSWCGRERFLSFQDIIIAKKD